MATVLPTFHNSSTSILRTPGDVAAYLIRFMFTNPGRTSEHYENRMISFQKLMASYEHDRDALAEAVQGQLQMALYQYFPELRLSVTVHHEIVSENWYKLIISIVDGNSIPVMSGTKINIQNGIITIDPSDRGSPTYESTLNPR